MAPPLFPLECMTCGTTWDSLGKTKDTAIEPCPKCQSEEVQACLSFPGNYSISGNNSASVRPKGGMTGRK
jgi:predicted nucleic acid-binding Zn ribbon protein